MKAQFIFLWLLIVVLGAIPVCAAQKGMEAEDPNTRSVQGVVADEAGNPAQGAVVQLKNTKTLQVRSFYTREEGTYYFHGLSMDVDYELKADRKGLSSAVKTLSVYDTRKKAVVNLKLESKK